MPAKKPSKPRVGNSKVSKNAKTSRWIIAVVLAIVVATGAFLVYSSFAIGTDPNPSVGVWCIQGHAYENNGCRLRGGGPYNLYGRVDLRSSAGCSSGQQYHVIQNTPVNAKRYPNWYCLAP